MGRSGGGWRLGVLGMLFGALVLSLLVGSSAAADPPAGCTTSAGVTTCVFAYTGAAQTWTVPAGVSSATFDLFGAQGGDGLIIPFGFPRAGGMGGEAKATLAVTSGQVLEVFVGGQGASTPSGGAGGFNGGAAGGATDGNARGGPGGGGGGASDVRTGSFALSDRVLVAGGGGGSSDGGVIDDIGGGGGGNPQGDTGHSSGLGAGGGVGGTQTVGGSGGTGSAFTGCGGSAGPGVAGSSGSGGKGGNAEPIGTFTGGGTGGGGGGGGYFGGGGGGGGGCDNGAGGGGGGGSSTGPTGTTFQNGVRSGNGLVTISYTTPVPDLTISKSHSGNFSQGQTGAQYTITATNAGSSSTTGTVTVADTLPAGLTATGISGSGWSCTLATLTCTRSDALAGSGSYPPITLTVNVASNAPSTVTNSVSVSGGGETNTGNDTASDQTAVTPVSQGPSCNGRAATIYVNAQGKIVGGPDNGRSYRGKLNGSRSADVIVGTSGRDEIEAKGGDDTICAGDGKDEVEGGDGNDTIFGEGGNDELEGGDGNDTITGGLGADKFKGDSGRDRATDYTPSQGDTKSSIENF
jgi:uncharacterized repeat protein (TIGR01451 family)